MMLARLGRAISVLLLGASYAPAAPALVPDRPIESGLGRIEALQFSFDGRMIAAVGSGGLGIWDSQSGALIKRDAQTGALSQIAFNRTSTSVAFAGTDGRVSLMDLRTGARTDVARHAKTVTALAFNADGSAGASGDAEGNVQLWSPERGAIGALRDGTSKSPILFLGFSGSTTLLSLTREMNIVTWDTAGQRVSRRSSLQSSVVGRAITAASATMDEASGKLLVSAQLTAEPRGGALAGRNNLANPGDLRRDNVVMSYDTASGLSADPVITGDFRPDYIAASKGACYAVFTSLFRDQPRVHIWGLIEKGDDLLRVDLAQRASAIAMDPEARSLAIGLATGRVATWRTSGISFADCAQYTSLKGKPAQNAGPNISATSDSTPLLSAVSGERLAVLRFEATGLDPGLGEAVSEMIAGQLSNTPGLTVVERAAIDRLVKELEIQRSGLTTADAVRIGKGLNARRVLLGSVRRFGEDTYVLIARVVDVETQQVQGSREVTCERCREQNLPAAVEALKRLLVR